MKISISIFIFLAFLQGSCNLKDSSVSQNEDMSTEEEMLSRRALKYVDIGEKTDEIIKNLDHVVTYDDILLLIKERGQKNNVKCRKLDFNTFQFIEDIWTKKGKRINLVYLIENDSVRYGVIESIDSNYIELEKRIEFKSNNQFIERYINNHNLLYSTKKNISDFLLEVINTRKEITIGCGNAGILYGEKEKMLYREITKGNKTYIINLLTSMNPENQAMGIIGFRKLKEAGIIFDINTVKIVDYIIKKNTKVYACITCVGGFYRLNDYLKSCDWTTNPYSPPYLNTPYKSPASH